MTNKSYKKEVNQSVVTTVPVNILMMTMGSLLDLVSPLQDGSYLAELLLDKGYQVHGIIRRASTFNTGRIRHLYEDPKVNILVKYFTPEFL